MCKIVNAPIIRFIIITVFLSAKVYPSNAQLKINLLNAQLDSVFKQLSLPGLVVVLVNRNQVIYERSLGYADIETKRPYTINTIQNIGSVSKSFIGLAIMKAIELKYFTLDTDINDLLPFKVKNPYRPNDKITIRELTTHTSGILDNPAVYPNTYHFSSDTNNINHQVLRELKALGYNSMVKDSSMKTFFYNYLCNSGKYYSEQNFDPDGAGSNYHYSNLGSALAAHIIEIKSGMNYSTFANKFILYPMKMKSSGWHLDAKNNKQHAKLYYNSLRIPNYSLLTYPDGGLRTSANDLSKYLIEMIRGCDGQSKLLHQDLFKQIFTPQFNITHPPGKINIANRNKGLFWNIFSDGTIGIDGDDPGVSTYLFFNPVSGLGGLFMCNTFLVDKQPIIGLLTEATTR